MQILIQEASKVQKATKPLNGINTKVAIEGLIKSPVEACSDYKSDIVSSPGYHAFISSVERAFNDHRSLVLSPDMFWLMITQGLAQHINIHAEHLRSKFVDHQGQKNILVRRDDFIKGSLENPWSETFSEFSRKIKEYIGDDNHNNIIGNFSTTGPIEQAAHEVVLMDSMKSYFTYTFRTCCGIPEVIIKGTVEDWEQIRDKTENIGKEYKAQWWTDDLHPLLNRVVENVAGKDDADLWQNFFKYSGGSGGPFINGWINYLIPYLKNDRQNPVFKKRYGSITNDELPFGLCQTPFKWEYYNQEFDMEFIAGFVGTVQNEDLSLCPKIGWAVREKQENYETTN